MQTTNKNGGIDSLLAKLVCLMWSMRKKSKFWFRGHEPWRRVGRNWNFFSPTYYTQNLNL